MMLILGGVAGSGKTTVGKILAARLGWEFADADAFHSAANIAKMRSGTPLSDSDRFPWLATIGAWMDEQNAAGKSGIVACSALARRYRNALMAGRDEVKIVFLEISREEAFERLHHRHGHFFGEQMVTSQFAELEPPEPDENTYVVLSDRPPDEMADEIMGLLRLR